MEALEGYVERIIYRNDENGYTVLVLVCDGEENTCVGILPLLDEGQLIEAKGKMTVHPSYGEQFHIESYEEKQPGDALAIERYLGSGAIRGIGQALAGRIVRRFGTDTFRIMEMEPERLAEIKGISEKKAREIAQQVNEKRELREVMLFLSRYGVTASLAVKLYQKYGNAVYGIIRENPYQLADEVSGIGFRTADEIARRAGILADSDFRVKSAIGYVLGLAQNEGHVYLPRQILENRVQLVLETGPVERFEDCLMELVMNKRIVVRREEEEVRVYESALFHIENTAAALLCERSIKGSYSEDKVLAQIRGVEEHIDTHLDDMQRRGVLEAVRSGVMVLTGGPGTGKTTTIRTMISVFEQEGLTMALAAPTGRAAKRMSEAAGHEAKTIHRLLEVSGQADGSGPISFGRNAQNPLEEDVFIIDEMSMVDIYLLYALLCAVPVGSRLIMVGDSSQLPSVGPGCVLRDIIASEVCPVVRLTRIFRQAQESDIVVNAHKINQGEHMVLNNKSRDFFFMKRGDAQSVMDAAVQAVAKRLPVYVGSSSYDIQILTPTRKGLLGAPNLNEVLQRQLNPPDVHKRECSHGDGKILREGDKVMQIKNNYQSVWQVRGRFGAVIDSGSGVFNGDIGTISEINTYTETVTVEFDEKRYVEYPYAQLDELSLAYAVTIHKSQGSEYPAVVIPLLEGPRMLMNRNLIYTAVTRAKQCVVIIGDEQVFYRMVDNASQQKRYTALEFRLKQLAQTPAMDE